MTETTGSDVQRALQLATRRLELATAAYTAAQRAVAQIVYPPLLAAMEPGTDGDPFASATPAPVQSAVFAAQEAAKAAWALAHEEFLAAEERVREARNSAAEERMRAEFSR